jgi:BASS family bile acid:Na+ symporter
MNSLLILINVTIFTLMLTLGIDHSLEHLTALHRQHKILLRSLLAVLVFVPAVVIVLLFIFDLPPAVVTGMAVLAAAPGAPLTRTRSRMAAADLSFVGPLQLTLALSAVVVTPVLIAIFYALFDLTTERVTPLNVAEQVARVTFLPVVIGMLLQRFAPKLVATISKPLNLLANILFALLILASIVVVASVPELRLTLLVGWPAAAAILIMAVAAISIGHLLGGERLDHRAGLATASVARNIGLAMFIVTLSENGAQAIPTLLVYMLLGIGAAIPYALWIRRKMK